MKRWAFILLALAMSPWVGGVARATTASVVTQTWTHGVCRHCQTATSLNQVQFVSPAEAWAVGYTPPGEIGAGDYSILHTKDGGRSWKEYPSSYAHSVSTQMSFPNRREGWLLLPDVPNAENRLLTTSDAGHHWARLSLRDLEVDQIQFFGKGVGFAHLSDPYSNTEEIYATLDGGRRWTKHRLPIGLSVDRMYFIDATRGVLAGRLNDQIVVLRTEDGGRRWHIAPLDLPKRVAHNYSDLSVDDLSVRADGAGLLLVNKRGFRNGENSNFAGVFRTTDGGDTWTSVYRSISSIPVVKSDVPYASGYMTLFPDFSVAQMLDAHVIFIAKDDGALLVSTENGAHWRETRLPHALTNCRSSRFGLYCAAGNGDDFWVARISVKP